MTDDPGGGGADLRPDGELRLALRDLLPDYSGPADPLLRVGASIRRRRSRRRVLLAVGSAAAAAALVAGVPVLLSGVGPTGGSLPAGREPVPTSAGPATPQPPPPVYAVDEGMVAGERWRAGSTTFGSGARRCLLVDGAGFARDNSCFDSWRPGDPPTWYELVVAGEHSPMTGVLGVTRAQADQVLVRFTDGTAARATAVRTVTDPRTRFFAVVVGRRTEVRSVTAVGSGGSPLGPPVTTPSPQPCLPGPDNGCAAPTPTR